MAKSQAELDLIAQQHRASTAASDAMATGFARKTFAPPKVPNAPGVGINFDDLLESDRESLSKAPEPTPLTERPWYGIGDFVKDTIGSESLLSNLMIMHHESGFKPDMSWSLPNAGTEEFKALTEGLDEKYWEVFGKAVSKEHAHYLKFKVEEELDRSERMVQYGGVAGVLAANVLNPENFLLAMASGGMTWVTKGGRMARAMKNAGVTAVEGVAVEGALYGMQETRDEWDVLTGAVAGLALGGAFGALSKGTPNSHITATRDLDTLAQREAIARGLLNEADAKVGELRLLEDEIRGQARTQLSARAAGAVKRSELGALSRELGGLRQTAAREQNLVPEIEARMLKEDVASMGAEVAGNKARTKMRAAAAKLEAETRQAPTKEKLARAEKLHAEKLDAEDALKNLRKLERQESRKTTDVRQLVDLLDGTTKGVYAAKLEKARTDVATALKLSRKAESGINPRAPQATAQVAPAGNGVDTLSAARVSPELDTSVRDLVPSSGELEPTTVFPETTNSRVIHAFGRTFKIGLPRFDYANVLRGIKNEAGRGTAGLYVGDPIGAQKGLNPIGASEVASRVFDTMKSKFHSSYEPAFKAWLKEAKGLDGLAAYTGRHNREHRKEFGDAVDRALRTPTDQHSAAAVKAASTLKGLYEEFGKRAHDSGMKGFEHWKPDGVYAPRVFDWIRANALDGTYGTDNLEAFVVSSVRAGFLKAGVPLDEAAERLIGLIGKGYFKTIRTKAAGITPSAFNGVRLDDLDQIAAILEVSGVDALTRADALANFKNMLSPREKEAGSVRYAKGRTLLDEQHTARLWNGDEGRWEEKSFRDLFMQHDAEQLFENYARSMSGHIGLAEAAGVRSAKDHGDLMSKMADLIPDRAEREKVLEVMDDAYKLITGAPVSDTSKWRKTRRFGQALRNYNFVRVMNQVGFAQIPDAAAYLTPQYLKYSKQFMPELYDFMRRASDGTLEHSLAREVEELLATGTDFDNVNLFSRFEDEVAAKNSRVEAGMQKAEHALKVAGRVTSTISGLRTLTDFNQRLAGMSAMNRIVANIAGKTNDLTPAKLANLGLTPEKIARIKAMVDAGHVKFEGKHKLMSLNSGDWTDARALDDLSSAAFREARRMVQEEDLGDTNALMHNGIGKMLLQFRRFPLVAYAKQLGHGVVHGDAEMVIKTGLQVSLGSASYAAQMYLYSLSKPAEEQEAWRKQHLSPEKIFLGGLFRAGMFSLAPQAITSLYEAVTSESMDGFRTSGMGNGLNGIPAVDLTLRLWETASDIVSSASRSDLQYDQTDFNEMRRALPFQNAFIAKQMLDFMQMMLPKSDTDDGDEFGYSIEEEED